MSESSESTSWLEDTAGFSGQDLLTTYIAREEHKAQQSEKQGQSTQDATMSTPTQDTQPQAHTTSAPADESDEGTIMGMDRRTAVMVGGGALALAALLVAATR